MISSSPKWLITGGAGQLALALAQHPLATPFDLTVLARSALDITDFAALDAYCKTVAPIGIIHTAAYTAVDQAEINREAAWKINYEGTENVARVCAKREIRLIHLSTDYVFAGNNTLPYIETDATQPINFYGETKRLAEEAVRQCCTDYIILRISGVFSAFKHNFVKTVLRIAKEKETLRIVADQYTCPTAAEDIAEAILHLAKAIHKPGTYHFASQEILSWHAFAMHIVALAKELHPLMVQQIEPISSADYKTLAKRPAYSALNCHKIYNDYGIKQPLLLPALKKVLISL